MSSPRLRRESGILLVMPTLTELLIPAGSALAGTFVGGTTTILSQVLTNRGTFKREREARKHAYELKRLEYERDTLLALSELINDHAQLLLHIKSGAEGFTTADATASYSKVAALAARTMNQEAAQLAVALVSMSSDYIDGEESIGDLVDALGAATTAIGIALREDPLNRL
jgi:hypothetical protein